MAVDTTNKALSYRTYLTAVGIFIMTIAIAVKLINIQWVEGAHYRKLAKKRTVNTFVIPANKGNIYSADGSLLATSIPNYTIHFDAVAPKQSLFQENVADLAKAMSKMFGKPASHYQNVFQRARTNNNRFLFIAKDLTYTQFMVLKEMPIFKEGKNKGGFIVEAHPVRVHPIGKIAERTIGYERKLEDGTLRKVGIEGAFSKYLKGEDGKVLKQKMAKGEWKPIRDENEKEPRDGYDVVSTIDVFIQDIAHHALLKQLQECEAEHGCVVVMETKTGYVRAISNLGRDEKSGDYYETINYAIHESHEPGSTFKLVDLIALLDDQKVDTSKVYDRKGGLIHYYGKKVEDSHREGPQKISLARGMEISSNTVLVQAVCENYKENPQQFVERIERMGLDKPLGLPIAGEGIPSIPKPGSKRWSAIALPWMAFGYGVSVTPLQTLTLYNAIANNGEMIKPLFVSEIKEWNTTIKKYNKEVINPKICSDNTVKKIKVILENVVKRGTGKSMYSKDFSMAGKTGTAQANYAVNGGMEKHYISSFVGFFPADNPKYSCIVVVHKPSTKNNNYYGAGVAGPVFKRIAQKIFTDAPSSNKVKDVNKKVAKQDAKYQEYYSRLHKAKNKVPNLKGMPGMDAVALLENLGLKVTVNGAGRVKSQSIKPGEVLRKNTRITLELS
jgi:cell division protein FtsI (penicillin-binding protein 3)